MAAKKSTAKKVSSKKPTNKKTAAVKPATKATTKPATKVTDKKVETKSKHVSANVKKQKTNPWMISTLILGFLVIVLAIAIGAVSLLNNNNTENITPTINTTINTKVNTTTNDQIELLIIEDPTCKNCQVDVFVEQVEQNLIPNLKVNKISIETEEGKAAIKNLNLNQVPAYLFSANIEERDDWKELSGAFLEQQYNGVKYYLLNPQYVPNKVMIEEPKILDGAVVYGNINAPVTIYEFSDYECPFCGISEGNEELTASFKAQNPTYVPPMPKVFEEYIETGKVKLVFYNMALESLHPQVRIAHIASLCANEQGMWIDYHHKLFAERSSWSEASDRSAVLKEFAVELGLDETQFNNCLDSAKYSEQIDKELAYGASVGVSGTPAFFIDKNFLSGAQDYSTFKAILDAELNEK